MEIHVSRSVLLVLGLLSSVGQAQIIPSVRYVDRVPGVEIEGRVEYDIVEVTLLGTWEPDCVWSTAQFHSGTWEDEDILGELETSSIAHISQERVALRTYTVTLAEPARAQTAGVRSSVSVEGDIANGAGHGNAFARAKLKVQYGSQVVSSEVARGLSIATETDQTLGATVQGFGFTVTTLVDRPDKMEDQGNDIDVGLTEEVCEISIAMTAESRAQMVARAVGVTGRFHAEAKNLGVIFLQEIAQEDAVPVPGGEGEGEGEGEGDGDDEEDSGPGSACDQPGETEV